MTTVRWTPLQTPGGSLPAEAGDGELLRLLEYLPEPVRRRVLAYRLSGLVEIVLDLGRPVQLRWPGRFALLDHLAIASPSGPARQAQNA